tara:strand:+ start:184 stop:1041 length:858 start_codon:yes stop_codon:yes gene_type:complete
MNKNKIQSLIELARLDKPIGIYLLLWPSLLGLLLAGLNSQISIGSILIVIIGSVLVRSCGCVINDLTDYKIDKLVKRTANRPIPSGAITVLEAWFFFAMLSFFSFILLLNTNPLTIKLSVFFAFFIVLYPMTKRFIKAPQFFLGITFGSGSIIAYSLETSSFSISVLILYFGIIAWIVSFDTYYALQDKNDDINIGIYSTPILWGDNTIKYSKVLHLIFYASLLIIAIINSFSLLFFLIFIFLFYLFLYQNKLLKESNYLDAFKINNWVGMISVLGFALEIIFLI